MKIDKNSPIPLRTQIKEHIKGEIHAGTMREGAQLPTIRALSIELAINPNTVAQAYNELDIEGIIITERGRGTFVAKTPGEPEMQRLRDEKLASLVRRTIEETHRLGYSPAEIRQVVDRYLVDFYT